MVVLNKKRIIYIISCFMASVICLSFSNAELKKESSIQTSSTPVSSHTVILDAGHGQPDRTEQ